MVIYGGQFKIKRYKKDAYENGVIQLGKFDGLLLLRLFRLDVLAFIVATILFLAWRLLVRTGVVLGAGFFHPFHRASFHVRHFLHLVVASFSLHK